jgi:hypothetical protein
MLDLTPLRIGKRPWSSESRPVNEPVWQAWLLKNRQGERRATVARMKFVGFAAVVMILLALAWRFAELNGLADLALISVYLMAMILGTKYTGTAH